MKKIVLAVVCLMLTTVFSAEENEVQPANRITLKTSSVVAEINPYIYGGFIEHLGRVVYESIYNPDHPEADRHGIRQDTVAALRDLKMSIYRYPGGNFVSGYNWLDGVGPKEKRPTMLELAWKAIETNQFGTDEFMIFLDQVGADALLTVNLGTGTEQMAAALVEYCNGKPGTYYADMRVKHGHPEAYNIKHWCLGNEMYGSWQIGHLDPVDYAKKAERAAHMMSLVDSSIKLVPSLRWHEIAKDHVLNTGIAAYTGYISVHLYTTNNRKNDRALLAAGFNKIERTISASRAAANKVKSRKRNGKKTFLCFDEWGIRLIPEWHKRTPDGGRRENEFAPAIGEWPNHMIDAIVNAQYLNAFIRNADVVTLATYSTPLNWFAPIIVEEDQILKQIFYYAFQLYSEHGHGVSLKPEVESETYLLDKESIPYIDVSACYNSDDQSVRVFIINRDLENKRYVEISLDDRPDMKISKAVTIGGVPPYTRNTFKKPDTVLPRKLDVDKLNPGNIELDPLSLTFVELNLKED